MSGRRVVVVEDGAEFERAAARAFVAALEGTAKSKVGLSGGRTPLGLFETLGKDGFDPKRLELFWCDERAVPPDHAESNYGAAKRALLDPMKIPSGNVHRMEGERPAAEAAKLYDALLGELAPEGLDLAVLGLGTDGHTASLFPDSPALSAVGRATHALSPAGQPRVTLTVPYLNAARRHIVLVAGAGKAAMAKRALAGDPALPITRVRPQEAAVWVVSRSAAASA